MGQAGRLMLVWLMCFTAINLRAQVESDMGTLSNDSNRRSSDIKVLPMMLNHAAVSWAKDSILPMDTGFSDVHRFSPIHRKLDAWQDLGHAGAPAINLLPGGALTPGWRSGFNAWQQLVRNPYDKQYSARNPFTSFHYSQGNQNQIFIHAFHTQNITPGWNAVIDYSSLQSEGLYQFSQHQQRHFRFASDYRSQNSRYRMRATTTWNRFKRSENFGVFDSVQLFVQNPSIFIPNSTTANTEYRNTQHEITQYYSLGKKGLASAFSVVQKLGWQREMFRYRDPAPVDTLYPYPPVHSVTGFTDSFHLRNLWQESGLRFSGFEGKGFASKWTGLLYWGSASMKAGAFNVVPGTYFNQWYRAEIGHGLEGFHKQLFRASWQHFVAGYNSGDYHGYVEQRLGAGIWFAEARAEIQRSRAAFTDEFFYSNRYHWRNAFDPVGHSMLKVKAGYDGARHRLSLGYRLGTVSRWVYTGSNLLPAQHFGNLNYSDIHLNSRLEGRHIFMHHSLHRLHSSAQRIMPLPDFTGTHSVGYRGTWFKGVLRVRTGLDVWWTSRFTGYGYVPATGRFHVQHTSLTGAYPAIDWFISGQVKQLQFFVKMEHVNQGLWPRASETPYWSAAGYALEPRRMRLGIRWNFYN